MIFAPTLEISHWFLVVRTYHFVRNMFSKESVLPSSPFDMKMFGWKPLHECDKYEARSKVKEQHYAN
jgi:hypothetical protein